MMASDGEDMDVTPPESEVSAAENETDVEDDGKLRPEFDTDEESLDVEAVPVSTEEADMEELMNQLEDYTPTVPDALTLNILKSVRVCYVVILDTINCSIIIYSLA